MSTRPTIGSRLARGELLLMDGGTGSELQHRGVNVSKGVLDSDGGTLGAWSATAMADAPEVVRAIHEDYLRVGAEIIIANSYNTNRGQLALVGAADKVEEFSRLAITLAREARDRLNPDAYVAGSIAPTHRFPAGWDPSRVPPAVELARDWGDQATVLAHAGADFILIESISSLSQLIPAMDAATATGLPVLLGIHGTAAGTMTSGESLEEMMAALAGREIVSILVMCCPPEHISTTLPALSAVFDGPTGAYANIGYQRDPERREQYHRIDVGENTPRRYAEYCREWLDMGAQIIGGCCATSPEYILALRSLLIDEAARRTSTEGVAS